MSSIVNPEQYAFLPIEHETLHNLYCRLRDVYWVPQEVDCSQDHHDWEMVPEGTKTFVKFILCFFAQSDGLLNEVIMDRFKSEAGAYKDAKHFYSIQEANETIHNETYSRLIQAYFKDSKEQKEALNAIQYYPAVGDIAEWMKTWMSEDRNRLERIIAFVCVEGILFSSAFAGIYWIKRQNILPGLCKANEFIARDEGIHTEFGIQRYKIETTVGGEEPLSEKRIHEIISDAVRVCEKFTREALNVELVSMNSDDMIKYVKTIADHICKLLGYNPIYNTNNPFDWMNEIALQNKTNFFEGRVTEYAQQREEHSEFRFDLTVDF